MERRLPSFKDIKDLFAPKPGESLGLFQASTTIVSIAAIYIYFAGYVYCYAFYFGGYAVTLESLDLSAQFYMVRAFTALNNWEGICLVVVVLAAIMGYLGRKVPTWLTVLVMIAAFPALFHVSYATATRNARLNLCVPQNEVRLHFKESQKKDSAASGKSDQPRAAETGEPDTEKSAAHAPAPTHAVLDELAGIGKDSASTRDDLVALGEQGGLALILETKDRIILIRKPRCDLDKDPPIQQTAAHVYTLSRSDLDFTNVTLP
jgi:hypothetical protein